MRWNARDELFPAVPKSGQIGHFWVEFAYFSAIFAFQGYFRGRHGLDIGTWLLFGLGRGAALAGVGIGTSVALGKWFYRRRARVLAISDDFRAPVLLQCVDTMPCHSHDLQVVRTVGTEKPNACIQMLQNQPNPAFLHRKMEPR